MNPEGQKCIVSGNSDYGMAQALARQFAGADFFSRSHGDFNFSKPEARAEFAKRSLDYDIYISCSSLQDFWQVLLLREVSQVWVEKRKPGHIIVLSSILEYVVDANVDFYSIEKHALRQLCRRLSLSAVSRGGGDGRVPFKLTYLSLGLLDTPWVGKNGKVQLSCDYVAKTIEWVLNQPDHLNVSELALEPIQ